LDAYHAWYLTTTYGKEAEVILNKMKDFSDASEIALARAEAWFGVNFEMVNSLEDFFVRRTGRLYFDIKSIAIVRKAVVADLQNYLNWTAEHLASEQQRLDDLLFDAMNYYQKELPAQTV
jgi:glycerol kinase